MVTEKDVINVSRVNGSKGRNRPHIAANLPKFRGEKPSAWLPSNKKTRGFHRPTTQVLID